MQKGQCIDAKRALASLGEGNWPSYMRAGKQRTNNETICNVEWHPVQDCSTHWSYAIANRERFSKLQTLNTFSSCMQSYIDFEIQEGERSNARDLYERLLERTTHVKVWLSYAAFEAEPLPVDDEADNEDGEEARRLLEARAASGEESAAIRTAKGRR